MTLGVTDDQNYANIANALREMGSGAEDLAFKPSEIPAAIRGLRSIWGTIEGSILDQTDLQNALDGKAAANHNHDSRYYTESEINTKLNGKSDSGHTHDNRYYTESEIDTKLNNKSNITHTHDERYYTEAEIDDKFDENTIIKSVSGPMVSFDDGVAAPAAHVVTKIEPVQEGEGDPSPDNVRPISGWNRINITRTGKNLLTFTPFTKTYNGISFNWKEDGSVVINGQKTSGSSNSQTNVPLNLPPGNYYFNGGKSTVGIYIWSKTDSDYAVKWDGTKGENSKDDTFKEAKIEKDKEYVFVCYIGDNKVYDNEIIYPMICLSTETNTKFEPSLGVDYSITFPSEAGTVYGGSLDVKTGRLTVDRVMVTYDGSDDENWVIRNSGNNTYYYGITTGYESLQSSNNPNNKCNIFPVNFIKSDTTTQGAQVFAGDFRVRWGTELTVSEWKNNLSLQPLQIMFYLYIPLTYQLTPTEVTTLLGQNRIWADTGDVDVSYFTSAGEDVGKAFDNVSKSSKYDDDKTREMLTQSSESAMTASKNYTVGDLFIVNNQLLRATSTIATTQAITIGTNAEVVDLDTVISEKVSTSYLNNLISADQNFKIVAISGNRNSEETFTVSAGARIIVFVLDSGIGNNGVYIIVSATNGNVSIIPILSATNLTLSSQSSGKFTITKNSSYTFRYIALIASGTFSLDS